VMGIRGSATTNQTRLLAHVSNVLTVTNPTRFRQRQHALVDYGGSALLFASIRTALCLRTFCFLRYLGSICSIGGEHRQFRSESLFNARCIGYGQTVFSAEHPMRPICGILGRADVPEFGRKLVAQSGRWLGVED
jgi:hypothetical protein